MNKLHANSTTPIIFITKILFDNMPKRPRYPNTMPRTNIYHFLKQASISANDITLLYEGIKTRCRSKNNADF